jgi:hypothetical protein
MPSAPTADNIQRIGISTRPGTPFGVVPFVPTLPFGVAPPFALTPLYGPVLSFVPPRPGRRLPADGVTGGEDVVPAGDEGELEGVVPGDCVIGESEVTGAVLILRCRTCWPRARDDDPVGEDTAGEDTVGDGAGDDGAADVGAGDIVVWDGAVVGDTLGAPADVGPGEAGGVGPLHFVALFPVPGLLVAGGSALEVASPAGLGVAGPLASGVGAVFPAGAGAGAGAGEAAEVGTDVTSGDDCGVLSWLGEVLGAGISGLDGPHEAPGDGCFPLPGTLPLVVAVPPWPLPSAGCPLPVLPALPVPLAPDAGAVPLGPGEAMFTIACRTPGTASAVPAKKTTAARASTGLSQIVPARCPAAARAPFAIAAAARRPAAAAAAATASA